MNTEKFVVTVGQDRITFDSKEAEQYYISSMIQAGILGNDPYNGLYAKYEPDMQADDNGLFEGCGMYYEEQVWHG